MRAVDVLVVGAGPAGTAAAIAAHEAGLDVVVVDKAAFPRDKTCGDGLTTHALRLLERLGVDAPSIPGYSSVRETVLVSPSGRHVHLPLPEAGEHSSVVRRADLDAALVRRVDAAGIAVREHTAILELHEHDHGMRAVHSSDEEGDDVVARFVVAADGHWSAVRRLLNPDRQADRDADLGTWHAVRQYFRGVDDDRQWVLFERDILPGYAWVFPLADGRANVGFGVPRDGRRRSGKDFAGLWRDLMSRPSMRAVLGPDAEPEGPLRAWPIPASYASERLTDGRVLYVGDAAGVVDPMTGEGIAQALETGLHAAESIARGGTPIDVAQRYRKGVDAAIGRDIRFATRLQRVLSSELGAGAAIRAADLTAWTRRNFARWMFEAYPRAVLFTPDRWRRGMFTAPGAYRAA